MTYPQARAELKHLGIVLRKLNNGYMVNTVNGGDATSFTGSLKDCLETGTAMVKINRSWVFER
jgi:hypothetical protein